MQDFGDGTGRHVCLEDFADLRDLVAGFFAQLESNANLGTLGLEQTGAGLD